MLEKRKCFSILIGYIIGIIMGLYCKISIVLFYVIFLCFYLIFSKENKKGNFKLISFKRYFRYIKIIFNKKVLKLIIIFSIISNSIVLYQNYKYDNLYKDLDGKDIEITGIVQLKTKEKYKIKVITKGYKNTNLYLKNDKKLNLEYGDKITINGTFSKPITRTNYKGFDYRNYLKTLKIYGSLKAKNVKIISKDNENFISKFTHKLSINIDQAIENSSLQNDEKALIKGILLGDKENISEDIINNFSASNISYILAVSGMHIAYIIIVSNFIFNKLIGKHYSKLITSTIIFVYMCITNFTSSVVRAGVAGILITMSNFFYRKNDTWEDLSIALLVILFYNPFLLQNVGLQLSYAGTIGIIIFKQTLNKQLKTHLSKVEKRAIRRNKQITKMFIKILNTKVSQAIIQAILVTISANLMVMPIILISFNKVSISSLMISVITSFIIGPIVIVGLVFIIIRIDLVQEILSFLLKLMINIAKLGSNLTLNQIYLVTPSIMQIIIYYVFVLILNTLIKIKLEKEPNSIQKRIKNLLSLLKYHIRLNKKKIISITLIISLICIFFIFIPKNLKIYFIDVGQGDSSLIVTPTNKTILIDGGGSESSSYNVRRKNFNAIFAR